MAEMHHRANNQDIRNDRHHLQIAPAFLETPGDKEDRQRQQKLIDEARKKKEDKFEEYRDNFAKDFPKGISAHYAFLS